MSSFTFEISRQWNGDPINQDEKVVVSIDSNEKELTIMFAAYLAPQFIKPNTPVGFTHGLWDYDVFEIFFLRPDGSYLEVEVGPGGHWLIYDFAKYREAFDKLPRPLEYTFEVKKGVSPKKNNWQGQFKIPISLLSVTLDKCRVNFYQIRTTAREREYLAWRSIPAIAPDFHKTECFDYLPMRNGR